MNKWEMTCVAVWVALTLLPLVPSVIYGISCLVSIMNRPEPYDDPTDLIREPKDRQTFSDP